METNRRVWSWEETVLAFELYCTIPSGKVTAENAEVVELANAINRTANSVKLKIQNFKTYDASYTANGRLGLSHGSKLDKEVVEQFINNWEAMATTAASIKASLHLKIKEETEHSVPFGYTKEQITSVRIGQSFFRRAVLSAYNNACCVTGISMPQLLTASHIKPWSMSDDKTEKVNPQNGLCLNAFHDRAFDRGLMTILPTYKICISSKVNDYKSHSLTQWLLDVEGQSISLPSRYLPSREFLQYHNDVVFLH
jgi:putative restriction endonuclease